MLDNISEHIVVYTSSKRYYGWITNVSGDDEPRREIVLGDPKRIWTTDPKSTWAIRCCSVRMMWHELCG